MQVKLLNDQCMLKLERPERLSATKRLFIPDAAKRQAHELYQAQVVAVGPGVLRKDGTRRPVEARPGDRVMCYWPVFEMPENVEFGGCRIVREGDIQAVIQ